MYPCEALGLRLKITLHFLFTAHLSSGGISIRVCNDDFQKTFLSFLPYMSLFFRIPSVLLQVALQGTLKEYSGNFIFKIYHNLVNYNRSFKIKQQ